MPWIEKMTLHELSMLAMVLIVPGLFVVVTMLVMMNDEDDS